LNESHEKDRYNCSLDKRQVTNVQERDVSQFKKLVEELELYCVT